MKQVATADENGRFSYSGQLDLTYNQMVMDEEGMQTTENKRIFIGRQIDVDEETFEKNIEALDEASRREDKNIRELVHKIVPEYRYQASPK